MTISEVEVVPLASEVETSEDELTVTLVDGRRISIPLVWFPRLLNASPEERSDFLLIGGGEGIHWPRIDEDISVSGLLRGTRAYEPRRFVAVSPLEYRRHDHDAVWHWCTRCSAYPDENYFSRRTVPTAHLCSECATLSQDSVAR
jgi:Protein of unknown function (DUF2442)